MPQFLQTLMGYTAQSAGLVLSASGVVLLIEMPIVGQLTTKFPAKYIIAFGWLRSPLRMYLFHHADRSADQLPGGDVAAGSAGVRPGVSVRADHAGQLTPGIPPEKSNRRLRPDQFHAQHRQQRGNLHGHHAAGAAGAISSIDAVLPHHQLRSGVSESGGGLQPGNSSTPGPARPMRRRRRMG